MTLDEAIQHAEKKACQGEEHRQLAGWLRELQKWRALGPRIVETNRIKTCEGVTGAMMLFAMEIETLLETGKP